MAALVQLHERRPRAGLHARALNRSGTHCVTARGDLIEVHALATWQLERRFPHAGRCLGLALSDDASRVLVLVDRLDIQLLDARGRVVWRSWQVPCGYVEWNRALGGYHPLADQRYVALSPDNRAALVRFDGRLRPRPMHPPSLYLCDLSDKRPPRSIELDHGVLFSPDGRWIPRLHESGGVQLWDWRQDVYEPPMRPRDANTEMFKSGDGFRQHDPVRGRPPPPGACWPDKSYTRPPESYAASYGHSVLAWTRRELLEVGPLRGPDYASIRAQFLSNARALAVDYSGELLACATYGSVSVLDLPRRSITSRRTRVNVESLVFGPDGLLYARRSDNAILGLRVDRP